MQTEGFTDNAFNPVSAHRITHLPVNADTQTTVRLTTGQTNKCKPFAAQSLTTPVYLIKLPGLPQKTGLGEPVPLHLSLSGQPLTPLGTPALDLIHYLGNPHFHPATNDASLLDYYFECNLKHRGRASNAEH